MVKEQNEVKPVELSFPEDKEIQQLHQEIGAEAAAFANRVSDRTVRIGQLLTERKAKLRHGQFERWVAQRLPFTVRTAQRYMKLFSNQETLAADKKGLPVQEAVQLVLSDKTTQEMSRKNDKLSLLSDTKTESDPPVQPEIGERKAETAPAAKPSKDPDGREIPDGLRPVFAAQEQFKQFAQVLSTLKGQVTQAIAANPVIWSQFDDNTFRAAIAQAHNCLTLEAPFIVCSYCGGTDSDKCKGCKGTGFLSKAQARCVPRELRQI